MLKPGTKIVYTRQGVDTRPVGSIGVVVSEMFNALYLVEWEKDGDMTAVPMDAVEPWHWLKKVFKYGPKISKRARKF